jgi:hypothetical protein
MSDIDKIMEAARAIPSFKCSAAATAAIIDIFTKLGLDLGYDDSGPGWLYDVLWCEEKPVKIGKLMTRIPMALESELCNPDPHLDGDFLKLVQARADIRVWITSYPDARLQIDTCKEQIRQFFGTLPGDQYVFVVYDRNSRQPIIEKYVAA